MTDFTSLQCFRSRFHRILELSLVGQSCWNLHPISIANALPSRVLSYTAKSRFSLEALVNIATSLSCRVRFDLEITAPWFRAV